MSSDASGTGGDERLAELRGSAKGWHGAGRRERAGTGGCAQKLSLTRSF